MKLSTKIILPIILISALLILLTGCFGVPTDESPGFTPGTITGIIAAPCCENSAEPADGETTSPEYWCFYCEKEWKLQDGVEVVLTYGEDEVATTTTNENGEFTFSNVDPGKNYVVTAYCPDYDDGRPLVKDVALELVEGGSFDTKVTDIVSTSLGLVVDFLVDFTILGPEDIVLDDVIADKPDFPNFPKFKNLIYEVVRVLEACQDVNADDDLQYALCRAAEEISGLNIGCGPGYTPGPTPNPCAGNIAPVVNKIEYSDDGINFTEIIGGTTIHVISGESYTVRADVSDDKIKDPLTFQVFLDGTGLGTYPYPGDGIVDIPLGSWALGTHEIKVEFYDGCTKTTWGPVTVVVEPITYTLTLYAGLGGSVNDVVNGLYDEGTVVGIVATPDSGYAFSGWTVDLGAPANVANTGASSTDVTMNEDMTLTANFTRIQHTLTLYAGLGGSVNDVVNGLYDEGTVVGIVATPDSGYAFSGWTVDLGAPANVANTGASSTDVTMNEDMTLTANFTRIQHTLTLYAGLGGSVNDVVNGLYDEGTVVGIVATPDSGYAFSGWTVDLGAPANVANTGASSTDVTMNEDMTLTANFTRIQHTLTLYAGLGGSVNDVVNGLYDEGTVVGIVATPDSGYAFSGWTVDLGAPANVANTGASSTDVTMNEDMTLTANFTRIQHTLTLYAGLGGSVNDVVNGLYDEGTVVGIVATPDSGYAFSGWTVDLGAPANVANTGASSTDVTMNEDMTLTANFTRIQHTLTLYAGLGGSVNDVVNGLYDEGTVVGIVATPDSGYAFSGWTVDLGAPANVANTGASSTDVTMNEDMTLTANFTEDDRITFFEVEGRNSNSGNCNGHPGETYIVNSPVETSHSGDPDFPSSEVNWPGYSWLFDQDHTPNVKYINFTARSNNSGTTISYSYRYKQEKDGVEDAAYCNWIFVETLTVDANKEIQSECMDAPSDPSTSTFCFKFEIQIIVNGSNPKTYIIHIN